MFCASLLSPYASNCACTLFIEILVLANKSPGFTQFIVAVLPLNVVVYCFAFMDCPLMVRVTSLAVSTIGTTVVVLPNFLNVASTFFGVSADRNVTVLSASWNVLFPSTSIDTIISSACVAICCCWFISVSSSAYDMIGDTVAIPSPVIIAAVTLILAILCIHILLFV